MEASFCGPKPLVAPSQKLAVLPTQNSEGNPDE